MFERPSERDPKVGVFAIFLVFDKQLFPQGFPQGATRNLYRGRNLKEACLSQNTRKITKVCFNFRSYHAQRHLAPARIPQVGAQAIGVVPLREASARRALLNKARVRQPEATKDCGHRTPAR